MSGLLYGDTASPQRTRAVLRPGVTNAYRALASGHDLDAPELQAQEGPAPIDGNTLSLQSSGTPAGKPAVGSVTAVLTSDQSGVGPISSLRVEEEDLALARSQEQADVQGRPRARAGL